MFFSPRLPVAVLFAVAVLIAVPAVGIAWWTGDAAGGGRGRRPASRGARWARGSDLRPLRVRSPRPGRLVLGRHGRRLLAADPGHSVLVLGPTQSLKTAGFAIPAILEWTGPVVATSVKTDLVRNTVGYRAAVGRVWVIDPAGSTLLPATPWSPLAGCGSWRGARRTADWLVGAAQPVASTLADADFWYATAAKLLAPLLLAAAATGRTMADVVRWVDTQERDEVEAALLLAGDRAALTAAGATWGRDPRQRGSAYAVAETVLAAYADPQVLARSAGAGLRPEHLLAGGWDTAYLCAPSHEQARLRPVFATVLHELLAAAFERAEAAGRPLDPPLLVVLDEAANIAPLRDLDVLASTAAGHGIQLVTVFQDLAQARARYGDRATTIVNNHRAKVLLAGIADVATLEYAAQLVGDAEIAQRSATRSAGGRSTTSATTYRRLAPADAVRRLRPGDGLLVYGHLAPARIRLRPWFADRRLRALAGRRSAVISGRDRARAPEPAPTGPPAPGRPARG